MDLQNGVNAVLSHLDGIRTRDLLIDSQARYSLRYEALFLPIFG